LPDRWAIAVSVGFANSGFAGVVCGCVVSLIGNAPVTLHITPVAHPAERVLNLQSTIKVARTHGLKRIHNPDSPIGKRKTKQQKTTITEELSHPEVPQQISRHQDTRGVRALHTTQSSYLLPLPWQHHTWIAPAHRKTLRQQPFMI
jgi:hypothetical protein